MRKHYDPVQREGIDPILEQCRRLHGEVDRGWRWGFVLSVLVMAMVAAMAYALGRGWI